MRKLSGLARRWSTAFLLLLVCFSTSMALALPPENAGPLKAELHLSPAQIADGGTVEIKIDLGLDKEFHAYLERFKLRIVSPDDLKLSDYKITPTVQFDDTISKSKKTGIEKSATLKALLEVPEGFKPGVTPIVFALTYQACTKDHCLFPKTLELKSDLTIVPSPASAKIIAPPTATTTARGGLEDNFSKTLEGNLFSALLAVFVVGFLTSLTPCIYPMIPITLAILGTRAQGQSRWSGFALSLTYVLGIAFTYSALGIFAASTGSLFGSALGNPWVVSLMAAIFIVMALSMYGAFELQVPAFLRNGLGSKQTGAGFGGAFLTGLVAGVVASPCVGPVLLTILTYIAQTQNRFYGFLFLFTFAMGMGVLFLILGTFSQLISRVPKSGPWMDFVKFVFGTTMVAMAFYYVAPIYPSWLLDLLLGLALILLASAYGAFEPLPLHDAHSSEQNQLLARLRKGLMIGLFALGLAILVFGASKKMGFVLGAGLPGSAGGANGSDAASPSASRESSWLPYSDERLAQALRDKKPIIIDFSAEWCAACKELERDTFPQPEVAKLSAEFVLLNFDATNDSVELQRLKKQFKILGLPTLIFYDVHGVQRDQDLRLTGFEKPADFAKRMKAAL